MLKPEEKFLFNLNVFDTDTIQEADNAQEADPPPVLYSEAELEAAKAQAYAEGRKQAAQEEAGSRARQLASVMSTIAKDTTALFAQEQLREKLYEREAVDLALKIFEKLFPTLNRTHGFEELGAFIGNVLAQHGGRKKISIHVEPELVEGVEKLMEPLSLRYEGLRYAIVANHELSSGGCKIRWEDGGAVRNSHAIAEEIHHILQESLAADDAKGHDKDAPSHDTPGSV